MSRALKDWLTAYEQYTENSEPPKLYHLWTALGVLAGALQRKVCLDWGFNRVYPNLYVVLVGPSGKCRKGTAIDVGLKFLRTLNITVAAESITREALIRTLADSENNFLDPLSQTAETHCSMTVLSEEFGVFLGTQEHRMMQDLCDLYDARDTWTYRTKTAGTDYLKGVCLNLCAATTPEYLQSALPRDALGVGLASRIIFVVEEEKSKIVSRPFLSPEQRLLSELLTKDLEKINLLCGQFTVSPEVFELYDDWYENPERDPGVDDPRFGGYNERRSTHLRKLWMLSSVSRSDDMIVIKEDFHRGLVLLRETEKKMDRTFGALGVNELAPFMEEALKLILKKGVVWHSELSQALWRDTKPNDIKIIVQALQERREITVEFDPRRKELTYKARNRKEES